MSWLLEPPPLASFLAVVLYALGARRRLRLVGGSTSPELRRRHACFVAGVASIVAALSPPVDRWADELLWAHMLQHVVLMSVAPPLIVLGAPWLTIWRGVPLGLRRPLARFAVGLPRPLRAVFRAFRDPLAAFVLAAVALAAWHLPAAYDLTLRSAAVHDAEHLSFVVTGLLFWVQVLDSPPLHPRLAALWRAGYATAGAATGWVLAIVLALAQHPLYPVYAAVAHRPGGISALADQELAAGAMIGVGAIPFSLAVFVLIYQWLDDERTAHRPRRMSATA